MLHPLDEARAKLARAGTHLEELNREIRQFVETHPYEFWSDHDSEPGATVVRARALVPEEPVPLVIGAIVGDVLHNLRSALEYLAWQLAAIGKGPDNDTHFPICDTQGKWKAYGRSYVRRMRPEHASRIERLQPYHGGHRPLLVAVARLNNTDKHSLITAVGWGAVFRPPVIRGGVRRMRIEHGGHVAMSDGAPMFRIVEFEAEPGAEVDVDMQVPYTVLFGKAFTPDEVAASQLDLRRTARYIGLILRLFEADLAP